MSRKNTRIKEIDSDAEDREHLRGLIRKKDKRINLLEREVSRLTKYLIKADFDVFKEEEVVENVARIKAPLNKDWTCENCDGHDCAEIIIPQRNSTRKYITCRGCGNRTRLTINE